ncbi:hypothetical protein R6Q59_022723 [Mikania micrantha]
MTGLHLHQKNTRFEKTNVDKIADTRPAFALEFKSFTTVSPPPSSPCEPFDHHLIEGSFLSFWLSFLLQLKSNEADFNPVPKQNVSPAKSNLDNTQTEPDRTNSNTPDPNNSGSGRKNPEQQQTAEIRTIQVGIGLFWSNQVRQNPIPTVAPAEL